MKAPPNLNYANSVFINCPFDPQYGALFRAIVFTVIDCGFKPRCALEVSHAAQTRLDSILSLIALCRLGIHDISRTEIDLTTSLPRFNMPLELGLFLACRRYGAARHKTKACLIFDIEKYRYQKFISDIAGQDIESHVGDCKIAIRRTRDWLRIQKGTHLPAGEFIGDRYDEFVALLPEICSRLNLREENLSFVDLVYAIRSSLTSDR